jgi:zinc transporter 1/2/3
MKMFGTGVLICTSFIHMLPPAVLVFENPCLPKVFKEYVNWPGTIFLMGFLFTHFVQQQASNMIRHSGNNHETANLLENNDTCHHAHSIMLEKEKGILAKALEFGLCAHSIVVGFTVGTVPEDFNALFYAILIHQFFEGLALSAIIIEANLNQLGVWSMIILYSLSTPIGVALGIIFRSCKLFFI